MILLALLEFVLGIIVGFFSYYFIFIYPNQKIVFDEIIEKHKEKNITLQKAMFKCAADRGLIFEIANGDYFESGASLMKLICTNDKANPQKKHLKQIRHKIKPILFQHWSDVIEHIKEEGLVTLSDSNQYEGFETSLEALKRRGMKSGVYFKISKNSAFKTRMSAILGFEWESENPPFEAEHCLTLIADEYEKITSLINNQIDLKISYKNLKKLL